ncbi:protein sneaky [Phlebotomus argentipes]|uniref:protein sneaky n=1 Tax=Phlebotomus argentipes TaxID=94469 RepID=UPI002892E2DE|nr:protein sneaky [Phlebotomus argentipes]
MLCFLATVEFLCRKLEFLVDEDRPRVQSWTIIFLGRFSIGISTAVILWYLLVYKPFGVSQPTIIVLLLLIVLFGATSVALKSARCIFLLIFLQFLGKAGRSAIKTFLFGLVITGPIANISKNVLEVNRVFGCSSELAYNLTKTHIDLMVFPFRAAIDALQNVSQVKESFEIVNQVVDPLVEEVELEENSSDSISSEEEHGKVISENYYKKLERRCLEQMEKGRENCANVFSTASAECMEKFPGFLGDSLCWMLDIEAVCSSKENSTEDLCKPTEILEESFGIRYIGLLSKRDDLIREIWSVDVNYSYNESNVIDQIREVDDYKNELIDSLDKKKYILSILLNLMNFIIAFTYVKVVIKSCLYLYSYLMEVDFENIFITSAFREIDQKRAHRGERTLLPLKKIERSSLVDPYEKRRMENDYRDLIYHLLKFLLELIAVTVFVLLDWLFVTALDVVAAKGEIDFTQSGEVEVEVSVTGEGMMASVVANIISGFRVNRTVDSFEDNDECLPNPSRLFFLCYLEIYGLLLAMLLMIYHESYTNRMLFLICVFFYPLRQEERSLFLYNKVLLSRRDRFLHMRKTLRKEMRENVDQDFPFVKLVSHFRRLFPRSRRCLVCREKESKLRSRQTGAPYPESRADFVECTDKKCAAVYCDECWRDLEGVCVVCGGETGSFM